IEELAKSAVPYRIVMVTSNGTSFKNGTGQSIVSPKLFKGDLEITDATYRFNFNNNAVAGLSYTVNASVVNGTSVLKIDAYVGNDAVASDELTFINVNDGANGAKGADGNGIASSVIAYQAGASATVAPTSTWSSSPVSVPVGQYLWTRTIFTYTDTTTKTLYNVSRQGADGAKGADGIAGKDGVGISSTVITYGLSANETTQPTTWTSSVPILVKGQYLWTKTVWTYTDAKTETGYTKSYIAKDGNNGADGIAGKDGVGILSTSITYQASTSGTVVPSGTWSSQVPSVPNGQFLWTRTVWNYTDSTSETGYSVAKMGTDGADGNGIASTTVSYGTSTSSTTQPTTWTSTIPTVPVGQYLWTRTITDYTDASVPDTISYTYAKQGVDGAKGDQGPAGTSVKVSKIEYQAGTSATTAPTGTWSTSIVSAPAGQYLWSKTTMSDNSIIYGIARQGADGINGKDGQIPHIAYADKSTNIFLNSFTNFKSYGGYQGSVITSTLNNGAWDVTASGGTHPMKHIFSFNGTTGRALWYYIKIKNTHATNPLRIVFNGIDKTGASSFPTVTVNPGQTYVKFEQGICRTSYDFIQINIDAVTADKDIAYTIYDLALYNEQPFINLDFVNGSNKAYMGLYIDEIIQSSTDASKYAWTLIKGQKGDQGIPGAPGADGKTPYWHTAWANSADGKTDFSLTDSAGRKYRGDYADYTQTDSTDPTKYKWVDMTANVKVGGVNLLKGIIKTLPPTDLPNLKIGDFLTFSFDVNTSSNKKLRARLSFSGANKHYFSDDYVMSGTGRVSVTGQVPSGWTDLILYVDANLTATTITTITTEQYKRAKLELGNVATDYEESPEDTQLKIDSKADQALTQEQLLAIAEEQRLMKANLEATASLEEFQSKSKELLDRIQAIADGQKVSEQVLVDNASRIVRLAGQIGSLNLVTEAITKFMSFSDDGLIIGMKDGSSSVRVANDRISFYSAGKETAFISQGFLQIESGIFTLRLQIASFLFEESASGQLLIKKIR
ncbi:hypothetical protein ACRPMK_09915, partial [Streptococcus uberis]